MYIIYIYNYFDKKYLVVMMGVLIVSLIFFGLCNYYSEHSFGMFFRIHDTLQILHTLRIIFMVCSVSRTVVE